MSSSSSSSSSSPSIAFKSKAYDILLLIGVSILTTKSNSCNAFLTPHHRPTSCRPFLHHKHTSRPRINPIQRSMSNVGGGGGGNDNNRPPPGNGSNNNGPMDDFLDPRKSNSESDNLKRARAEMSDSSLPISFDTDVNTKDDTSNGGDDENDIDNDEPITTSTSPETTNDAATNGDATPSSSLIQSPTNTTTPTNNPFLDVVSNLSPSDLISKFTSTAHPRVQDAVRSTILSLIGTLPQMAFETTTITTGERLASLMFQLQMSGYMFKNAEYRLSLEQGLKGLDGGGGGGGSGSPYLLGTDGEEEFEGEEEEMTEGQVRGGTIKVSYGTTNSTTTTTPTNEDKEQPKETTNNESSSLNLSQDVEVDAEAYTSELRTQVSKLRASLAEAESINEQAVQKDLLLYIRTLPKQELQSLTGDMSVEVLAAMKGLVNVVMNGIVGGDVPSTTDGGSGDSVGDEGATATTSTSGDDGPKIKPDTVTEQSGEAMAQLCMWQLVVGYNLRELEVREELKNQLQDSTSANGTGEEEEKEGFDTGGFE